MTVKEAMEILANNYKPEDEIVIAWWDYALVNSWESLTISEWSDVVDVVDMDSACERMAEAIVESVCDTKSS